MKYSVFPSINKTGIGFFEDREQVVEKGQHKFKVSDAWADIRWGPKHFLLSWADQHMFDQRFRFQEDDRTQYVYPESESPWKFPDNIFVANFEGAPHLDGVMLEPPFFDPSPALPPSGSKHYVVKDPALPEYNVRLVSVQNIPVSAISWGQEKNIAKGTKLLAAPNVWQGNKPAQLGEYWENYRNTKINVTADIETLTVSGDLTFGGRYDGFGHDATMPHGDFEPIWNDGLDDRREAHDLANRTKYAHKRGTSDRFINRWGEYTKLEEATGFNAVGELEYITNAPAAGSKDMFMQNYDFKSFSAGQITWANPSHFNEVNLQNFHRKMTSCLTCYNSSVCKKSQSISKFGADRAGGRVGALGFVRSHYTDVPLHLNPDTPAGIMFADAYCMYSTGSVFEHGFAAKPNEEEMPNIIGANNDALNHLLKKYDNVSDTCHVNGMSRRAVEYDGHYRILLNEIAAPLQRDIQANVIDAIKENAALIAFPVLGGYIPCSIQRVGFSYEGEGLYKLTWMGTAPFTEQLGQYAEQYTTPENYPYGEPVIAWFTVRYDYDTQTLFVNKVWAYIWYISNHINKQDRIKIGRLVELKADSGRFYGNAMEVAAQEDFTGGTVPFKSVEFKPDIEAKRGIYEQVRPGVWVWNEDGFDLKAYAEGIYIDPSGTAAVGYVEAKGMPGDIIRNDMLFYEPPKLIKWAKSKTDPNTQNNVGKTKFYWSERFGWHQRAVGDFDDLFYHLSYQQSTSSSSDQLDWRYPEGFNRNLGAMKAHNFALPSSKGFYDRWSAGDFESPAGEMLNLTERRTVVDETYKDISSGAELEKDLIDQSDIVLATDMQHARNFTAPIFAYELTADLPLHQVTRPDYSVQKIDWSRRELEPIEVAAQREYAPVPAIWCYAQNSQNREVSTTVNLGQGRVEGAEGEFPIKTIWNPQGRVWWHKKGILGCMTEKNVDSEVFTQDGIAVVNFWRKHIPHHMEVVKAYLFLEPTLEHDIGYTITIGGRELPGFQPFQGMRLAFDTSDKKNEVAESWWWANYNTRVHNANQFLGGRIVSGGAEAQMDAPDIWELVKEHSPKILGEWSFPANAPMSWQSRNSTTGYTDWDIFHIYELAGTQSNFFLYDNLTLSVNGERVNSIDPHDSTSLAQRSPDWYNLMAKLYEADRNAFQPMLSSPQYNNNANKFDTINISKDAGEGEDGKPDPLGKGFGFSKRGGGWKSKYIFDITPQVKKAHAERFDAQFVSVNKTPKRQRTWEENKPTPPPIWDGGGAL